MGESSGQVLAAATHIITRHSSTVVSKNMQQHQQHQQQHVLPPDAATPQFLRVRRRRGAVTVPSRLRLDLDTTQHASCAAAGGSSSASHQQHYYRRNHPQPHQPHCPNEIPASSLNQCQQDLLTALASVGFDDDDEQDEQQQPARQEHAAIQFAACSQQVIFRRVSDPIQAGLTAAADATGNDDWNGLRKRSRVLDAVILEDDGRRQIL